jgi:hypothetical protein
MTPLLAIPIIALSFLAVVTPSAAAGRDQCYLTCAVERCEARYACEQRNAGRNCFTNLNKCKSFCRRVVCGD